MSDYAKLAEMLGDLDEDGVLDFLNDFVSTNPSACLLYTSRCV